MYLSWTEHGRFKFGGFFSYHQDHLDLQKLDSRWLRLKVIVSSSEGAILVSIESKLALVPLDKSGLVRPPGVSTTKQKTAQRAQQCPPA
jgi:hypothetical protein